MRSRRQFVADCSIVAAVALVPTAGLCQPLPLEDVSLRELDLATFAKHLDTTFHVRAGHGETVDLKLVKAQPLGWQAAKPGSGVGGMGESFSLIFHGHPGEALPQDTYCIEHRPIGRFTMFIVPVGQPDGGKPRYQAIFNRLLQHPDHGLTALTKEKTL